MGGIRVGGQYVWKFMVNFRAVGTLKPADYQHYFLANTVYVLAFPAANDF